MSTPIAEITPIAYTIANAVKASNLSRSRIYEYIKDGQLPVLKSGRRVLIAVDDLRTLIDSLRVGENHATR